MNRLSLLLISLGLFLAGLVLIYTGVSQGTEAANAYLVSHGGGMDGTQFTIIIQESIHTYQWIGVVLSIVGGLGLLRCIELRSKE